MTVDDANNHDLARCDDPKILAFLAFAGDKISRYFVANNINAEEDTLETLSGDRLGYIRSAARRTLQKKRTDL